jgi:hypothetical protein
MSFMEQDQLRNYLCQALEQQNTTDNCYHNDNDDEQKKAP